MLTLRNNINLMLNLINTQDKSIKKLKMKLDEKPPDPIISVQEYQLLSEKFNDCLSE